MLLYPGTEVTQIQPRQDGRYNSHIQEAMMVGNTKSYEIEQWNNYKDKIHHCLYPKKKNQINEGDMKQIAQGETSTR